MRSIILFLCLAGVCAQVSFQVDTVSALKTKLVELVQLNTCNNGCTINLNAGTYLLDGQVDTGGRRGEPWLKLVPGVWPYSTSVGTNTITIQGSTSAETVIDAGGKQSHFNFGGRSLDEKLIMKFNDVVLTGACTTTGSLRSHCCWGGGVMSLGSYMEVHLTDCIVRDNSCPEDKGFGFGAGGVFKHEGNDMHIYSTRTKYINNWSGVSGSDIMQLSGHKIGGSLLPSSTATFDTDDISGQRTQYSNYRISFNWDVDRQKAVKFLCSGQAGLVECLNPNPHSAKPSGTCPPTASPTASPTPYPTSPTLSPTASPTISVANLRDNSDASTSPLKLAHDAYKTNTATSIIAAEGLYKKAVAEFTKTLTGNSLLTKGAKKRYNLLLHHDSLKPTTDQVLAGKTPYAASELVGGVSVGGAATQGLCSSTPPAFSNGITKGPKLSNGVTNGITRAGAYIKIQCNEGSTASFACDGSTPPNCNSYVFMRCEPVRTTSPSVSVGETTTPGAYKTTSYQWVNHGTCDTN